MWYTSNKYNFLWGLPAVVSLNNIVPNHKLTNSSVSFYFVNNKYVHLLNCKEKKQSMLQEFKAHWISV